MKPRLILLLPAAFAGSLLAALFWPAGPWRQQIASAWRQEGLDSSERTAGAAKPAAEELDPALPPLAPSPVPTQTEIFNASGLDRPS
ncbi:MAG: hypothetical protein V4726_18645 [Verrucomicrobiota bacterium]